MHFRSVYIGSHIHVAHSLAHLQPEQCRKDDLEMWLYQQIELTHSALL